MQHAHMLTTISILMCHAAWISWTACHGWTHSETHHSSACYHCCLLTHLLPHLRQHLLLKSAHCQRFAVVAVAAAASAVLPATPLRQVKTFKYHLHYYTIFLVCLVQQLCMLQTVTCHSLKHAAHAQVSNLGSKPEGKRCVRQRVLHNHCALASLICSDICDTGN
jgi:hypothetical protein